MRNSPVAAQVKVPFVVFRFQALLLHTFDEHVLVFFACGSLGMVQVMTNLVKELGLPETQLKLESFAGHS